MHCIKWMFSRRRSEPSPLLRGWGVPSGGFSLDPYLSTHGLQPLAQQRFAPGKCSGLRNTLPVGGRVA